MLDEPPKRGRGGRRQRSGPEPARRNRRWLYLHAMHLHVRRAFGRASQEPPSDLADRILVDHALRAMLPHEEEWLRRALAAWDGPVRVRVAKVAAAALRVLRGDRGTAPDDSALPASAVGYADGRPVPLSPSAEEEALRVEAEEDAGDEVRSRQPERDLVAGRAALIAAAGFPKRVAALLKSLRRVGVSRPVYMDVRRASREVDGATIDERTFTFEGAQAVACLDGFELSLGPTPMWSSGDLPEREICTCSYRRCVQCNARVSERTHRDRGWSTCCTHELTEASSTGPHQHCEDCGIAFPVGYREIVAYGPPPGNFEKPSFECWLCLVCAERRELRRTTHAPSA